MSDGSYARLLQTEYYKASNHELDKIDTDSAIGFSEYEKSIGLSLQVEFDRRKNLTQKDEAIAKSLQMLELEDEEDNSKRKKIAENLIMTSTSSGKAWKFVESVLALHKLFQDKYLPVSKTGLLPAFKANFIEILAIDELVNATEKLLDRQAAFRIANVSTRVDIGYHYTENVNVTSIKNNGLLNKMDRENRKIDSFYHGSSYGEGVYTANNPYSFHKQYGNTGLLLIRLIGKSDGYSVNADDFITTFLAKTPLDSPNQIVVLRSSDQCAAVVRFNSACLEPNNSSCPSNQLLHEYHRSLQLILDELFNIEDGHLNTNVSRQWSKQDIRTNQPSLSTPIMTISSESLVSQSGESFFHASSSLQNHYPSKRALNESVPSLYQPGKALQKKSAPRTISEVVGTLHYTAPDKIDYTDSIVSSIAFTRPFLSGSKKVECPICLEDCDVASAACVRLRSCGHVFHEKCIRKCISHKPVCPSCRGSITGITSRGFMPSGTMTIKHVPSIKCTGHEGGTLQIHYKIQGDIQKAYHEDPGSVFSATSRTAYVPSSLDGIKLVWRLREAFIHGLTFTVGTSLTTGRHSVVTWASIPHKTNYNSSNDPHSFPDPYYIENCNDSLDNLNVTKFTN